MLGPTFTATQPIDEEHEWRVVLGTFVILLLLWHLFVVLVITEGVRVVCFNGRHLMQRIAE